jgi:hypothetical protein
MRSFALTDDEAKDLEAQVAASMVAFLHRSLPNDAPAQLQVERLWNAGYSRREIDQHFPTVRRYFEERRCVQAAG